MRSGDAGSRVLQHQTESGTRSGYGRTKSFKDPSNETGLTGAKLADKTKDISGFEKIGKPPPQEMHIPFGKNGRNTVGEKFIYTFHYFNKFCLPRERICL